MNEWLNKQNRKHASLFKKHSKINANENTDWYEIYLDILSNKTCKRLNKVSKRRNRQKNNKKNKKDNFQKLLEQIDEII